MIYLFYPLSLSENVGKMMERKLQVQVFLFTILFSMKFFEF